MMIVYLTNLSHRAARALTFSCVVLLTACSESELTITNSDPFAVPDTLIEIYSPTNGEKLPAHQPFILDFAVVRGIEGSYVRIRVDKLRSMKVKALNARHHIEGLPPGPHRISIKEYTAEGKATGGVAEINLYMEEPTEQ